MNQNANNTKRSQPSKYIDTITLPPKYTIWGKPNTQEKIAEGIVLYTTPSHGGYWLSEQRYADMPAEYKKTSFTMDNWFEEDCSWCGVVLAWPEEFSKELVKIATKTYEHYYAKR